MRASALTVLALGLGLTAGGAAGQRTVKPVLHGRDWVAITGKPLGATAGALIFAQGGNAVDAACAMLGAVCTMYDVLSWGGETQALIYNPKSGKVIGVNALGVAPTGATAEFYRDKGYAYPPEYGPLAAVTPGTPGGLLTMLAEFGTMSLAQVLAPARRLAEGYPIEKETADAIEKHKERLRGWPYSRDVLLPHPGREREAPEAGEVFRQPDLADTLGKLVEAERLALAAGRSRKAAIYAAYDRFYKGDIARELVRGTREQGGLITLEDLAGWQVRLEEPVTTTYKGIEVFKLTSWVQGPVMLQALNMLETLDLKALGFNSAAYIHTLCQVMNLAFADRDFYYGDPYFPPREPLAGLLSKAYARERVKLIRGDRNDPDVRPGDPYPFEGKTNPYLGYLEGWLDWGRGQAAALDEAGAADVEALFRSGTTSIQAADKEGWVVSMTPSGGWLPCVIAGRTGVGLSQRAQSFVLDERQNPFNVIVPGKRPRATLTPGLALKDGRPYLSFAVQGGDTQDQNLLQFFLDIVEFGMGVQQACEAPNVTSYQMHDSFADHKSFPGKLDVHDSVPAEVRDRLRAMGYVLAVKKRTSGPINAILFDRVHGTFWGGSSDYGEDYGIAW
ncbi:MAG TPA: gamma-glutamyltransferase [Candidatus Aminicenantes bacterium]|nr:gamma-glutamyltransferase [Candidatus Aminicenantes bacterium]HRY65260.1 gamma-glutamyltransferase [Candidatus Aminicenantes bacterium]HRZ72272.1 gamma-glutamyltransferase [Candidatus Aminicenantes bacterium]